MKKNKEIKLQTSVQMVELIKMARETNGARIGFGLIPSQEQFLNGVIYYWVRKNAPELSDFAKKVPEVLEHKSLKNRK
jgi:hypothetical protein